MKTGYLLLTLSLLLTKGTRSSLPEYPFDSGELKTRAEYYTEGGRYRGGVPQFDDNYEVKACTDLSYEKLSESVWGNATMCMAWTSNGVGAYESQLRRCTCQSAMNDVYCEAWGCSDLEPYETLCPGTDSICGVEKFDGGTRCVCEVEADSGNFCSSWVCLETDYEYGRQYGDYSCARASDSGKYCEAWTGVIQTSAKVETSSCRCIHETSGSTVCDEWECKARSLKKCSHAGAGWCDLRFSLGIGGLFGSLGAALAAMGLSRLRKRDPPISRACAGVDIFVGSVWMAAWSVGVIIWGGQNGAIIVAYWWGGILAVGMLCGCFNRRP